MRRGRETQMIVPNWHQGKYGAFDVMIQKIHDSKRANQLVSIWKELYHPNILKIHCVTGNSGQQEQSSLRTNNPIFYVATEVVHCTLKDFVDKHSAIDDNSLFKKDKTSKYEMSSILKNLLLSIAETLNYLESKIFFVDNLDINKIYVSNQLDMYEVIIKLFDGIQDSGTNTTSWGAFRRLVVQIFDVGSKQPSEAVRHLLQQNVATLKVDWEKLKMHPSFFLSLPLKQWLLSEAWCQQFRCNLTWPTSQYMVHRAQSCTYITYNLKCPLSLVNFIRHQMVHLDEANFQNVENFLAYVERHVPNLFLELLPLLEIWS